MRIPLAVDEVSFYLCPHKASSREQKRYGETLYNTRGISSIEPFASLGGFVGRTLSVTILCVGFIYLAWFFPPSSLQPERLQGGSEAA